MSMEFFSLLSLVSGLLEVCLNLITEVQNKMKGLSCLVA